MPRLALTLAVLLTFVAGHPACADVFQLKTGGEVVGTLVARGERDGYVIRTVEGATLTLSKLDITKIVPEQPELAEYQQRSRSAPDTTDAHRELAAWCTEHRLQDEAKHHLRRLLELDPTDQAARLSLGFQRHGNRWMSREQIMQERGMVLYEGKYRTPQDVALRSMQQQREQAEADWYGDLKLWKGWLNNRRAERVQEAERSIAGITDPRAVPALLKWLENEPDEWTRRLLLETMHALPHPDVVRKLVQLSVESNDPEERVLCLDYLLRLPTPVSLTPYVKYLTSKKSDNVIVNRAGYALGQLGNKQAISPLIDRLITRHKYRIGPEDEPQINANFSPTAGGGGGGLSMGGKGPKFITKDHNNLEVLRALSALSGGQDFGYNQLAWRRWFVNEQQYEYYSSRRDK
ncbi:HEAT repeat domain-containing protein [Adhaeretor mobilis]|uniref:HEAT repeat domain-containing protein n=1 Tax=Adhaeretor mobilis TaxID=1930276 RepID=A0A517N2Q8_9BACT|nr:HEAT repeat domain-containing protein [Adhaeretor mobilis]QDT01288.1 hypothetical protein HG15A2_46300 [Adhaeretor mobilis]